MTTIQLLLKFVESWFLIHILNSIIDKLLVDRIHRSMLSMGRLILSSLRCLEITFCIWNFHYVVVKHVLLLVSF